jgi:hypothetical protein
MTQRPKVVEVDLIVTRKYRTSMIVSSIDMEDLEEDTYEIDDWQITFEDW